MDSRMELDEHKEFEKNIPDFLSDRLENETLEDFLDHYDHCSECQDELSVRYLISTGLERLETGEPFHLQKELTSYVELERSRLGRRERFVHMVLTYEAITVLAFISALAASFVLGVW